MRITKEQLNKENVLLRQKNDLAINEDNRIRQKLTNVLNSWVKSPDYSYGGSDKEPNPLSWEEIFFQVGKLKADVERTSLLKVADDLRSEIIFLKEETLKGNQ